MLTAALYLFGLVAAGLLVAGAMVWLRSRPTPVPPEVEILRAGQAVIRRYLSPDVKTTFSDLNESTLELLSDGKWRVGGWVDVANRGGRVERQTFSLRLHKSSAGNWVGEDIFVSPQM